MTRLSGRTFAIACASVTLLVACEPKDEEYVNAVRVEINSGPVKACCSHQPHSDGSCAANAATTCSCVVNARVVSSKLVPPVAHERMARTVSLEIEGPSGKGSCHFIAFAQGGRIEVQEGSCSCADGAAQRP